MIKGSPLLFIGLVLFLWARGMTHDDTVLVGLGKSGHLELRSASAAVSLSASPGLHQLGKMLSYEFKTQEIKMGSKNHSGFNVQFKAPFDWQIRVPLLAIMGIVIVGLVFLMKMLKPS